MRTIPSMATLLTLTLLAFSGAAVHGKAIAIMPVGYRITQSDAILVGEVTKIEPNTVMASIYPGSNRKQELQVAVVKIEKPIFAPKGLTHIKVAYLPSTRLMLGGYGTAALGEKKKACLFLKEHPSKPFYVVQTYSDVVGEKHPNYSKEVKEAEQYGEILQDPVKHLKGKDAEKRGTAAVLQILRYRAYRPGRTKEVPIDADESRLLLKALADADWKALRRGGGILTPTYAFQQLGLTAKDGWTVKNYREIPNLAPKWLEEHADTYRIKKRVIAKK